MARFDSRVIYASLLVLTALAAIVCLPVVNAAIQSQTVTLPDGTTDTIFVDTTTMTHVNETIKYPDGSYMFTKDNGRYMEYRYVNGSDVTITSNDTTTVTTVDWNNGTRFTTYSSTNGKMLYAVYNLGNGKIMTLYPNGTEIVSDGSLPPLSSPSATPPPSGGKSEGSSPSGGKSSAKTFTVSGVVLAICSAWIALTLPGP